VCVCVCVDMVSLCVDAKCMHRVHACMRVHMHVHECVCMHRVHVCVCVCMSV
jgi:hypothetical protein